MARYKVSYKVLREQGEELKAAAKLMDGYTERVNQIRGKLGSDEMLASVRNNLQKLAVQMGESRAIINMAGSVLTQSVEGYATLESRQVKKVDALKAHNRDFYKNPVVVASAGGAAAGGATGAAAAANTAAPTGAAAGPTTVEYTQNNTVINYNAAPEASAAPADTPAASFTAPSGAGAGTAAAGAGAQKSAAVGAGIAAGAGALGAAAGAGGAYAAGRVKKRREEQKKTEAEKDADPPEDDPEVLLAQAIERVNRLSEENEGINPG
ncbi:MAG: hypothetical protein GXY05_15360 [Clostridiales bacterium]|nr:hypothetical protein [Clostridiales bacterium]